MNDIMLAIYLVQLKYATREENLNDINSSKMIEFSKILAIDEILARRNAKMEDVYELQLEINEFLKEHATRYI